ncbi:Transcriptional repressor CopY [Streptococcus canis]|uniref:Transcriptional repressor CopY n=1 Tax=Streptococcus canis TaxID=1329 RepID=A0A3P5Y1H4_STRCB|nr:CopY/TcrY family copper transport repressor [Streptococcus canis]QKG78109.1 CopY/TcrY family copper transport repressor [Streptococcus canis]VDC43390.1 Transcriptional repressor CopY [Streptococcus canis]
MQHITSAEWEVMRVVWASGTIKSSDIIAVLGQKFQWSNSTIKTLIGRLMDKKALGAYREGRAYIYHALVDETELQKAALAAVLDSICQRKHAELLLSSLADLPMTSTDIADFQVLLEAKKEKTVTQVPCNCLPGQCHCQKKEDIND